MAVKIESLADLKSLAIRASKLRPRSPSSSQRVSQATQTLCISCRATEPNQQNINLHRRWGFRQVQKEHQKVRESILFGALSGIPKGPKIEKIQSRLKSSISVFLHGFLKGEKETPEPAPFPTAIIKIDSMVQGPNKSSNTKESPKGPKIEYFQSRLKFSISLGMFNPDLLNSPQKIGVWWVARLKITISLENFKIWKFFNLWALRDQQKLRFLCRLMFWLIGLCGSTWNTSQGLSNTGVSCRERPLAICPNHSR